jgi:hypothetical protein
LLGLKVFLRINPIITHTLISKGHATFSFFVQFCFYYLILFKKITIDGAACMFSGRKNEEYCAKTEGGLHNIMWRKGKDSGELSGKQAA